jgi:competence protein ComEC
MPRLPRAGWLAVGALVGALSTGGGGLVLPLPPWCLVAVELAALALVPVLFRSGRASTAALLLGLASVALHASGAALLVGSGASDPALPSGNGPWNGTVVDVSSPSGHEQRGFVRVTAPGAGGTWTVYGWLPRHPPLVPGDRISVAGTLEPPPPDAKGFADFLAARGAAGTLKGRSLELVGRDDGLLGRVEQLRWSADAALSRAVPEPEAGLAAGILIGLRERVGRAVADDFTTTGLTHVVAISGWNIALVAGIATAMLRSTPLGRRTRSALIIAAIALYTILAGAEASVVRAAVMGGVVLVARESGRPSGAAIALGLATWGLLLADPAMMDDIGLQLSLAATAGLLVLGGPAEQRVRRLLRGRGPSWFAEALGVSLAAQLATLPLILLHFGRLSLISPLANVLVAPIVPPAMLGAAVGLVVGPLLVAPIVAQLLAPLLLACWLPLTLMVRAAGLLAQVPFATVELVPPLDLVGAALASAGLAVAVRRARGGSRGAPRPPATAASMATSSRTADVRGSGARGGRGRRRLLAAVSAGLLLATLSAVLVARPVPLLRLSVLDVGQGDAILLEASAGPRLLVDGGGDPDLLVRRLDEHIPVWDRRLDLILLTHPHEDHAGGLAGLVPRYRLGRFLETGMPSDGAGVNGLRTMVARHGIPRSRLAQGDELSLGRARLEVLWPPADAIPDRPLSDGRAINGTSIVLAVTLGRQRALLTGDVEDDRDPDLLRALGPQRDPWDILKVSHHGSAGASSLPLLDALRPRLAAVSAGIDNDYGHPASATLDRLATVGATTWRTDQQGTLSIALDGQPRSAAALVAGLPLPACPSGREPPAATATPPLDPCYARPDGGTDPNRSALALAVHGTSTTIAAARHGRGRGGRVPGLPRGAGRHHRGPPPGRDGRAPP